MKNPPSSVGESSGRKEIGKMTVSIRGCAQSRLATWEMAGQSEDCCARAAGCPDVQLQVCSKTVDSLELQLVVVVCKCNVRSGSHSHSLSRRDVQ